MSTESIHPHNQPIVAKMIYQVTLKCPMKLKNSRDFKCTLFPVEISSSRSLLIDFLRGFLWLDSSLRSVNRSSTKLFDGRLLPSLDRLLPSLLIIAGRLLKSSAVRRRKRRNRRDRSDIEISEILFFLIRRIFLLKILV